MYRERTLDEMAPLLKTLAGEGGGTLTSNEVCRVEGLLFYCNPSRGQGVCRHMRKRKGDH
jgi:hypothetical protein